MLSWGLYLYLLLELACGNLLDKGETVDCQQFRCSDNSACIRHGWVCDGMRDCQDGSDELPHCVKRPCSNGEFRCHRDGSCIQIRWLCDGQVDCIDGSDEENCESCRTEHGLFLCQEGHQCLQLNMVCDGKVNCPHGDDESTLCSKDLCASLNCDHYCWPLPSGVAVCSCKPGYALTGTSACTDVNECILWPPVCSQLCDNQPGNYTCSCHEGYNLNKEGNSCQAQGGPPVLYYSTPDEIVSMNLVNGQETIFHSAPGNIVDLAYDVIEGELYWCDQKNGVIYAQTMHGFDPRIVVANGLESPEGIDVDWVGRNIYFADSTLRRVMACSLDGRSCANIIDKDIEKPRSVIVDPGHGLLYWSDWGALAKIEVCALDGSERRILASENVTWPNGLVLDSATEQIYWVDANTDVVECIKIDGTGRRVIVKSNIEHPFSIAVFEDTVYWSDWFLNGIMAANKFTGKEIKVFSMKAKRPIGLHVHQLVLQPRDYINPCGNKPCSHVCLLNTHGNFTCSCPVSMVLQPDGRQCRPKPDAPFLLVAAKTQIIRVYLEVVGRQPMEQYYSGHQGNIQAIDYHWKKQKIVYSDNNKKHLILANISYPWHQMVLADSDLFSVDSIAVDWVGGNLYWVDTKRELIEVGRIGHSARRVLIQKRDVGRPSSVAVSPVHQYLFYSSTGHQARITRCNLAGTHCIVVVSDILTPRSLVVDESSGRIFWVEEFFSIESAMLNGGDRQGLIKKVQNPQGLAVFGDRLYWTELDSGELKYSNKITGESVTKVFAGIEDASALVVVHPRGRISVPSPCTYNNGGCSDLCIPHQLGVICLCSAGSFIGLDNATCEWVDTCKAPLFVCGKLCLSAELLCDGNPDCILGEDEEHCSGNDMSPPGPCQGYLCDDRECVASESRCDGKVQCADNSDELRCGSEDDVLCSWHQFSCGANDSCITKSWVCDGTPDCENGSDEKDCPEITCAPSQFSCPLTEDNERRCIIKSWLCDGENDCENGEDEQDCSGHLSPHCTEDMFMCHPSSHQCIPRDLVCDGYRHCIKGEDEIGCEHLMCTRDQFQCKNSVLCISRNRLCDGYGNCPDGSDEEAVMCRYKHVTGQDSQSCNGSFCLNGGTCMLKNKTVVCSCRDTWRGLRCEVKELLVPYPIMNGSNHGWIGGLVCFIVLSAISLCGTIYYCRRRRRVRDRDSISVVRFRNAMKGDEVQNQKRALVPESYENPGFCDDDINANKLPLVSIVNSPSDGSLDSAFVSRPEGLEVQEIDCRCQHVRDYS